jgi:hypothetical protein
MSENIISNDLESEIAELTRQIENKKRALEAENSIVREDKEVVAETIAEHFYSTSPASPTAVSDDTANDDDLNSGTVPVKPNSVSKDYLDTLPPETIEAVNTYVAMIPKAGIRQTVNKVQMEQPFIIDAFHDALVTRLYDELKERGIIK